MLVYPIVADCYYSRCWILSRCGPCVMLSKELEGVKQALGDSVRIVKLVRVLYAKSKLGLS